MFVNEYVDEVHAHVRFLLIQLEEMAVITLCQSLLHVQGVDDARLFLLLSRQLLHHSQRLHFHAAKDLIQNLVSYEILQIKGQVSEV